MEGESGDALRPRPRSWWSLGALPPLPGFPRLLSPRVHSRPARPTLPAHMQLSGSVSWPVPGAYAGSKSVCLRGRLVGPALTAAGRAPPPGESWSTSKSGTGRGSGPERGPGTGCTPGTPAWAEEACRGRRGADGWHDMPAGGRARAAVLEWVAHKNTRRGGHGMRLQIGSGGGGGGVAGTHQPEGAGPQALAMCCGCQLRQLQRPASRGKGRGRRGRTCRRRPGLSRDPLWPP